MKKYEFTGETKTLPDGTILHRIRALVRVGSGLNTVEEGELGGWIEKEENLSHDGNAWVYGNATVLGNARVYGNALVCHNACVCDNANICDNSRVYGNAIVYGNAWVCDDAMVYGYSRVCGDSGVYGYAEIYGSAEVCGMAKVYGDASVFKTNHYLVIGPIGSRDDFTTFFRCEDKTIKVKCGCFRGTINKFLEKVEKTHGDSEYAKVYRMATEMAIAQIDMN